MPVSYIAQSPIARVVGTLAISATSLAAVAQTAEPLDCILEPHRMIALSAPTDGVVATVLAERSDIVVAGQELARLESSVENATADVARERARLNSDVRLQEVGVALYASRRKRTEKLYKRQAVSMQVMEEVNAESSLSKWKLRKARDEQIMAGLERKRAEAVLARRSIRTPVDGVVVQRMVEPGESVDDRAVFRIAQLDPLNVEVILPVAMFGLVEAGTLARVTPEIGGAYDAKVKIVDRVVDASSGTFGVRLELPNPDYRIPPGLSCQVSFATTLASNDDTGAN